MNLSVKIVTDLTSKSHVLESTEVWVKTSDKDRGVRIGRKNVHLSFLYRSLSSNTTT